MMSWLTAQLFKQVQSAPFYEALHREAVALLPSGEATLGQRQRTWLDVGCGPGLVARLAAQRGYATRGIDFDLRMLALAQTRAAGVDAVQFLQGNVFDLGKQGLVADVVSAASLLAVLPNRTEALRALLKAVSPGGTALIVEPSKLLTPANAQRWLAKHADTSMAWVMRLWAHTRHPDRVVMEEDLHLPGWTHTVHPLLDGMVHAWILRYDPKSNDSFS